MVALSTFRWPERFDRVVPGEDWAGQPLDSLALKYDTVQNHGWYHNLDRTVVQLGQFLQDGQVLVDYSGGTGILTARVLSELDRQLGVVIVDASPKFLRLALEKFAADDRVAFRLIRYRKESRRLDFLDEVLGTTLSSRRVDAIASTNAIHLYYDLADTLRAWTRVLRPAGRAFVQSGNLRNPAARADEWIIDETVDAIDRAARTLVQGDSRWAAPSAVL